MGHTLGGFRCVTLDDEGNEKCLSGRLGEIWESGPSTYKALIVLPTKSEKIISFKEQELKKWVFKLKIPANPDLQALYANNPNNRDLVDV